MPMKNDFEKVKKEITEAIEDLRGAKMEIFYLISELRSRPLRRIRKNIEDLLKVRR